MIISKTPLRASFFGGGTDFADYYHHSRRSYGTVLSATLDMHVYIMVNKRFDKKIRVVYMGNEFVNSVDEVQHNIIREALKITGITGGIEIIYTADLPMTNLGIGLASSSALAVGVLNAIHAYKGEYVTAKKLAEEAIDIEINKLGQQIGVQDQFAVSYGGFNRYFFNADDTISVSPMSLNHNLFSRLLMFYTGKARDSRNIFIEQKKTTTSNAAVLDPLVDAVEEAQQALYNENFDIWGELLNKTWEIKKSLASGISNSEIDEMYRLALENGATGGKILGAGGGGFLLLYVPPEKQNRVKKALSSYSEFPFHVDMQGTGNLQERYSRYCIYE